MVKVISDNFQTINKFLQLFLPYLKLFDSPGGLLQRLFLGGGFGCGVRIGVGRRVGRRRAGRGI